MGYHVFIYFRQIVIRMEMTRLLRSQKNNPDETMLVFAINDKKKLIQLQWEGDDEFGLDGEMYDVIEKKTDDGYIFIRCIADKKETALVRKVTENARENERTNKMVSELFQVFQGLFNEPHVSEPATGLVVEHKLSFHAAPLPFRVKEIPTPPPQGWFL